jgi:hypothetical protein
MYIYIICFSDHIRDNLELQKYAFAFLFLISVFIGGLILLSLALALSRRIFVITVFEKELHIDLFYVKEKLTGQLFHHQRLQRLRMNYLARPWGS